MSKQSLCCVQIFGVLNYSTYNIFGMILLLNTPNNLTKYTNNLCLVKRPWSVQRASPLESTLLHSLPKDVLTTTFPSRMLFSSA
jgi:hypothetical protein